MFKIKTLYNIFVINILFILKFCSGKHNYMHVGKGLYYTKIERALQECSDNFLGLQNIETSIFIEAGVYKPSSTLRSTIFGETSTINFIGEGVDETIIECNNLSRLIGLEMNNKYSNHIWTFKNMTLVGCKNNFETAKTISGHLHFENVKFIKNYNGSAISCFGTCHLSLKNTTIIDSLYGPNIHLQTNGVVDIYDSQILGFPECTYPNPNCKGVIVNLISNDRVTLTVENSIFSDSHYTIDDESNSDNDYIASIGANGFNKIIIKNSIFQNSGNNASGALTLGQWNKLDSETIVEISGTTFKNNYGKKSGVIRTAGQISLNIYDSTFYNNTSMLGGIISNSGDLTINGEILNTKINVYNCSFENPWTSGNDIFVSGRLYTSYGYEIANFSKISVKKFKYGDLFYVPNAKVKLTDCIFSDMSLNSPLINLLDENEIFEFDGCVFKNINIQHDEYGLIYTKKNAGKLTISNSSFENIKSENAAIILSEINYGSNIRFFNTDFNNIYSNNGIIIIKNEENGKEEYNGIIIDDCHFKNCSSRKTSLISVDYGSFCNIMGSSFIHCGYGETENNNIYQNLSGSILQISGSSEVKLENSSIDSCYSFESGGAINLSLNSKLNITNSIIKNCKANKNGGVFYFNNWEGKLYISGTEFNSNIANRNGGIFEITGENILENAIIDINESKFKNNNATFLGGIIYIGTITSKFDITKNLKLKNSYFVNNKAKSGEILFTSEASQAKYIFDNNYDDSKVDSHPNYLSWNNSTLESHMSDRKIIMSGDNIPNGLTAYILSDTFRVYDIIKESTDSLSNIIFVNATMLDKNGSKTNEAIVTGDRETFCWSGVCIFNSVKIYGNPGDYILQIYVISNGGFISMNSEKITVDVTIEKCNRIKNRDYLNIGYNICYDPVCSKCSYGKCVDMNICECDSSGIWTGPSCDEKYKYEYSLLLRIIYEIICTVSALFSVLLIFGIWSNKEEVSIKKSNPIFLIITVVGSIINYSTVIFYHGNRTNTMCTIVLWVKYIGFAVLYGSIMIRIMRVWKIVSSTKQKFKTSSMSKKAMFNYLFLTILIYIVILLLCTILQEITVVPKEYSKKIFDKCKNSKMTILLYGFTIAMLLWGVYLALETSNLPEQFNEAKSVGISTYVYAFAMSISEVIDNLTELNPDYNFLLMITSMLIYTWTSIFTIVVPKIYSAYSSWFIIFDILKRNANGTENVISIEQSQISNNNCMDDINKNKNNVGRLSVIERR